MNHPTEDEIHVALMPAPMDAEPSDELLRKLRTMARTSKARKPLWPSLLPVAVAGGAAALIVAASLLPVKAEAKSFDMVVAAAKRVNAFQFSIVSNDAADPAVFTVAGIDGHVYMRAGKDGAMEVAGDSMTVYDGGKTAMRFKFGGLVDPQMLAGQVQGGLSEGLKEMNLPKMLEEYRHRYGNHGIAISPVGSENGHDVYHVTLAAPDQPDRVEMTVDSDSDLPERVVVTAPDGDRGRTTVLTMEMRFGNRVDASLLHSSIPAGVKVQEMDLGAMVGNAAKGISDAFEKASAGAHPSR